jgi:hypothetical protein
MSEEECFKLLHELLTFPCAQICRHHAAALVLMGMSKTNPQLEGDPDFIALVEAVCRDFEGDEEALAIIRRKSC